MRTLNVLEQKTLRWLFVLPALFVFMEVEAFAAPAILTYQGRILSSNGSPLEASNVSFIFQITNPSGSCIIYQEQVTGYSMVSSGGVFDVPIGIGSIDFPLGGSFSVLDAFNSSSTFACGSCTGYTCTNGPGVYAPQSGDARLLRVQFNDGTAWKTISPDNVIRSVPFAGYAHSAEKLGTNVATDFLLKAGLPTCGSGTFLSWNGTTLTCAGVSGSSGGTVTSVSSSNSYLTVVNGTTSPAITLNVGTTANTVAAGNDPRLVNSIQFGGTASGDLSGTYPGPTVAKLQGVSVSSAVPTSGQFFKFNGTNWISANIATSDVSGLGSYMTQAAFSADVGSAGCTTSQTMYWNSVSSNFQCQSINVGLAGDVTGSMGAAKVVALQNSPVDSTVPTNNQILQWNGSKWTPTTLPTGNSGTVTSVSGAAPISVATGSSTPVISISQATTSTNGYLSSADWNTFNGKQNHATTLSGYGIIDGVQNAGNAVSMQSGLDAGKLTAGTNGRFYAATDTQKIYFDNGSAWIQIASNSGGSGVTNIATGTGLSGGPITTTGTISLANTAVAAGSYGSATQVPTFTVDAQGRLTSASNTSIAIPWSAIISGTPTTLSGYGISDSVKNAGGTPSIQTGNDAAKPASPSAGAIYSATDTNKIYQYNSGAWVVIASSAGSGGTITALTGDASASGSGSVAATVNSVGGSTAANVHSAELVANAATNANTPSTIVKRDASGNFSAGTIAANLTGNVTGSASLNVLKAGDSMTGNLNFAANIGNVYTAGSGSNTVTVEGPSGAIGTSYFLRLPTSVASVAGQTLTSDTSGNLSWTTPSTTATAYTGVLPVANGGTNSSTALNNNRIIVSSGGAIVEAAALTNGQLLIGSTGAAPVAASLTAGSGITITPAAGSITIGTTGLQASSLADGKIWVGQSGTPTAVTPSGDATMTNAGAITVGKLQGTAVSATAPTISGHVLRYNGTSWAPNFVSMFDLRSTITGAQAFSGVGCTSSQTVTWTAATDNLSCTSIAVSGSQVTYSSQTANTFFAAPNGSAGAPTFRAIASADLPSGTLSGSGTAGYIPYYSASTTLANSPVAVSGSNVGIGTTSPAAMLNVSGGSIVANSQSSSTQCVNFSTGNIQVSSYSGTNSIKIGGLVDGGAYTLVLTGYTSGQIVTITGYTDTACSTAVATGVDFGGSSSSVTSSFTAAGNTQLVTFIYSSARGVVYASVGTNFYH